MRRNPYPKTGAAIAKLALEEAQTVALITDDKSMAALRVCISALSAISKGKRWPPVPTTEPGVASLRCSLPL